MAAAVWGWCLQPNFTPIERLLIRLHASSPFTPEAWARGDAKRRGDAR